MTVLHNTMTVFLPGLKGGKVLIWEKGTSVCAAYHSEGTFTRDFTFRGHNGKMTYLLT